MGWMFNNLAEWAQNYLLFYYYDNWYMGMKNSNSSESSLLYGYTFNTEHWQVGLTSLDQKCLQKILFQLRAVILDEPLHASL